MGHYLRKLTECYLIPGSWLRFLTEMLQCVLTAGSNTELQIILQTHESVSTHRTKWFLWRKIPNDLPSVFFFFICSSWKHCVKEGDHAGEPKLVPIGRFSPSGESDFFQLTRYRWVTRCGFLKALINKRKNRWSPHLQTCVSPHNCEQMRKILMLADDVKLLHFTGL